MHQRDTRRSSISRGWSRTARALLTVLLLLGFAALQQARACDGPRLIGSKVRISAMATNIDAEGTVGSTSKSSFFGFGRKKTVKDMPANVQVGVMQMSCNAAILGSDIDINASASNIRLRGGTVRVGGLVLD